ncbi:MAG: RES domain-containing protein [Deltaproteobacteria bacterium]|nr:RES domain-containing protein [Deltaproteobacteria bacterium]
MKLFRITGAKHAATAREAFSGEGGRRFAGRWHTGGLPVVYTASSFSLAQLETLVHTVNPSVLPKMVLVHAELPSALKREHIDPATLPRDWALHPPPAALQALGQAWLVRGASVALVVPSAISPDEENVLINPLHPEFARIVLTEPPEPYEPDVRLHAPKRR